MPTALREAVEHGSPDVTAFVTQHCNEAADTVSISVTIIFFLTQWPLKILTLKAYSLYYKVEGTIQQAPRMHVISVYFCLNLYKLYDGPIRLLADHDFTVRCIQVE